MKKLIIAISLSLTSNAVLAENTNFVNGDGSIHSELCIAATQSDQKLKEVAAKRGYSTLKVGQLNCNGMNISKFAKMYRADKADKHHKSVKVFSFDSEVKNLEADICIAAATSNDKYRALREGLTKPVSYYRALTCNGMSLSTFARKFGNKSFKI